MKWRFHSFILFTVFLSFLYGFGNSKSDLWINFDIKIIQNENPKWVGQVYVSDNMHYDPMHVKQIRYKQDLNVFQHVTVGIHNVNRIKHVRLDPLLNSGLVEVKNFTLYYKGELYPLNLSSLDLGVKHNISIIRNTVDSLVLKCSGVDPFIELSHSVRFKSISWDTIQKSLTYTAFLYIVYLVFLKLSKINLVPEVLWFSILILYTLNTLFFLSQQTAASLLILSALLSVGLTLYSHPIIFIKYLKNIFWFLFIYLLLGYISLYFSTGLANPDYFYEKIFYIALAILLPMGFYNIKYFNQVFFKRMLTFILILMAIIIFLLDQHFLQIDKNQMFGLIMERSHWTQKNYMFWYILLMFATLSFYNIQKKCELAIVVSILILSYFIVFGGYSLSARLSFGMGTVLFILLSIFNIQKKYLLTIIWIFTVYIIFSPIIFALIDFTFLPKLVERDAIYKTSLALIKEHWFFGYGYGSTLSVHIKDFVSMSNLPSHYLNHYPGGHPHNLSLLFWLEFGIVGALFLAYYIHLLLKYIIENTYAYTNQAGLLSMVLAFDIITSFSWSIWYPQVLLTFAFFGIMLTLSMNIRTLRKIDNKVDINGSKT